MNPTPAQLLMLPLLAACGGVQLGDSGGSGGLDPACNDGLPPDDYVAGLTAMGVEQRLEIRLVDVDPAPPDVGDNRFEVEVLEQGAVVSPSALSLRPWMPLHGHGTTPERFELGEQGAAWIADDVDLFMAGLWTLTFTATTASGTDEATFRFCLEG